MNVDRLIGSITIAAFFLVLVLMAFSMWEKEKMAANSVSVLFSEIGALQNEDAVTIRGYKIGYVASITMANDSIIQANDSIRVFSDSIRRERGIRQAMALVKIDLYEPFTFNKDTRFRNISPSILGSRSIAIELGKRGQRAPKDFIFTGEFESGFAEVLALSDVARKQVATLMELIRLLYSGDSSTLSLQQQVESVMADCENLINVLSGTVNSVEKQTFSALHTASDYAGQISDASIKIGNTLDTVMVQAHDGVEYLEKLIADVQATVESLSQVLDEFQKSPIAIALLDSRDIIDDISALRATLESFLSSVDNQGLVLYDEKGKRKSMLSLKNLHLFRETARSKAKKRAEAL